MTANETITATDFVEEWVVGSTPQDPSDELAHEPLSEQEADDNRSTIEPQGLPTAGDAPMGVRVPPDEPVADDRIDVRGEVWIDGEKFEVLLEDRSVLVAHPRWSLEGVGATLGEAESDLLWEARDLAAVMSDLDPSELDGAARDLRDFCLRFRNLRIS